MKTSAALLYVGAACCMLPGATAWNGGLPRSFVRGDTSPKAASVARSGATAMPFMSLGDDGFGRRDALSAMLASATLLSLGGPAAAKDVGDGGLPAGLKEYFEMLQTKKQVVRPPHTGELPCPPSAPPIPPSALSTQGNGVPCGASRQPTPKEGGADMPMRARAAAYLERHAGKAGGRVCCHVSAFRAQFRGRFPLPVVDPRL